VSPNVILGPPNITESTRARKLKLKMQLDIVQEAQLSQRGRAMPRVVEYFG